MSDTTRDLYVVAGSYDGRIYGWKLEQPEGEGARLDLQLGSDAHDTVVKCLALAHTGKGLMLATGSEDETIRVFDLTAAREVGTLMEHTTAVSCMQFYNGTHLLSGSMDGKICIFRVSDWAVLHTLGGHRGAVHGIAVHPSGKLCLSVSADGTMRVWDLVNGRPGYIKSLPAPADSVYFSPSGALFALIAANKCHVHSVADGEVKCTVEHNGRIHSLCFISDDVFAISGVGPTVRLWRVSGERVREFDTGFRMRVRNVSIMPGLQEQAGGDSRLLACCSADAAIKVYSVQALLGAGDVAPICDKAAASDDVAPRITCASATPVVATVAPFVPDRKRPAGEAAEAAAAKRARAAEAAAAKREAKKLRRQEKQKERGRHMSTIEKMRRAQRMAVVQKAANQDAAMEADA